MAPTARTSGWFLAVAVATSASAILGEAKCIGGAQACPSQESVLLQMGSAPQRVAHTRKLTCETCAHIVYTRGECGGKPTKKIRVDPAASGCEALDCEVQVAKRCAAGDGVAPTCSTCAEVFQHFGLCEAVSSGDIEPLIKLEEPAFAGCGDQDCRTEIGALCAEAADPQAPPETMSCEACAATLRAAGGCEADAGPSGLAAFQGSLSGRPDVAGCLARKDCRGAFEATCSRVAPRPGDGVAGDDTEDDDDDEVKLRDEVKVRDHGADSCEACAHVFIKSGDCSRLFKAPVVDEMLPEPCRTVGPRCLERISAGCHSSAEAPCRTAREGDACFGNVRWAMERGISQHPEWYPGLSRASSFEQFQMQMFTHGEHNCSAPCPEIPRPCRDAVLEEDCYAQVSWAVKLGISSEPEAYPSGLVKSPSCGAVQAWLHQIHQADCPMPCQ